MNHNNLKDFILNNYRIFLKYCLVGVLGTLIDIGSLYIFVEFLKLPIIPASVISFVLAVINNFLFNKFWTFQNSSKNYRKQFIKFFIISSVGLLLNTTFMYLFVYVIGIWYIFAKILTSGIVLNWNFFANKFWTFKQSASIQAVFQEQTNYPYEYSIVVPAYNESKRIIPTLEEILNYQQQNNLSCEIIVVNDGSTDNTLEVLENFQKLHSELKIINFDKNHGKGFGVKNGMLAAQGKYILFTDADNSTPIAELEKLSPYLKDYSVIIGSRYTDDGLVKKKQAKYRIIISRLGNWLIQTLIIKGVKDTQCGFKLFHNHVAKTIFSLQKIDRFGFDIEILAIAQKYQYNIKELGVVWINSAESHVRPVKDTLITLKDLMLIKANLLSGRYDLD
jgi:dolichyl-phosphate beta-glucosyltransferase